MSKKECGTHSRLLSWVDKAERESCNSDISMADGNVEVRLVPDGEKCC